MGRECDTAATLWRPCPVDSFGSGSRGCPSRRDDAFDDRGAGPVWGASARRVSLLRTPRARALLVLGVGGVATALLKLAAWTYTDVLWFRELGYEDVFWTTLKWRILAQGLVGFGTASFLLANFALVDRVMAGHAGTAVVGRPVVTLWRQRWLIYPLVATAGGRASKARWPAASWQTLLLWVIAGASASRPAVPS